jgi:hypothetical protein
MKNRPARSRRNNKTLKISESAAHLHQLECAAESLKAYIKNELLGYRHSDVEMFRKLVNRRRQLEKMRNHVREMEDFFNALPG